MQQAVDERRELAIKRLKARNDFRIHLVCYLTVSAMLVVVWAFTSAWLQGFFWPIIPMAAWGVGIIIHAYSVYAASTYTEEEIQQEMKRLA